MSRLKDKMESVHMHLKGYFAKGQFNVPVLDLVWEVSKYKVLICLDFNRIFIKLCIFFSSSVQAWIHHIILLHLSHLPLRLGQIPLPLHLQVVHSSWIHAFAGGSHSGAASQTVAPPALRGQKSHSNSTGLGEDRS